MTKVAFIGNENATEFVKQINDVIKDKKVIDIKYQTQNFINGYNGDGVPTGVCVYDRALIIYEE